MKYEDKLKHCPFCGSKAGFNSDEFGEGVFCKSCGATLRNGVYGEYGRKLASSDWNARPIENSYAAEIKRLRKALEEIKQTVIAGQNPVYPFVIYLDSKDGAFILETVENALKGGDK